MMRLCKYCNTVMNNVLSFSKGRNEKFFQCPKCHDETRHQKIKDDELEFGEVINKDKRKRK